MPRRPRPLALTAGLLLFGTVGAVLSSGCGQGPIETPVRSLQSSGPVAFVCLGADSEGLANLARPLSDCASSQVDSSEDFSDPHLYALVTQPNSGQVAVVDLTTPDDAVLDVNASSPGDNFLPVGAIPTAIVSTASSTATFVSSAEANYEGIYALPSDMIRSGAPRLTSWPACGLPAAPGEMTIVVDPTDESGDTRPSCDADYGAADTEAACRRTPDSPSVEHCNGELRGDAAAMGTPGRLKLLVSLPAEGGIAVIDAQDVLDRDSGTRDPCTIERWLPLEVQLPPPPPPPEVPEGSACVPPEVPATSPSGASYAPFPAGMAAAGGRLYVADRNAPVIHRLQVDDPCDPHEIPPLVTSSAEDPFREVFTSEIAISPLTLDLKRYLYAVDVFDASIMVFDVSDQGGSTRPLERPLAFANPFQPRDRIFLGSPPRQLVVVRQQRDDADPTTGSTIPLRCDPDPDATGPATQYRTSEDYESGARPLKLRGVFAFAVLENGDVAIIDIDDFDGPCRGPGDERADRGCTEPLESNLETSEEFSCLTVSPHEPRAGTFLLSIDGIQDKEPGINAFPLLFGPEGTVIKLDDDEVTDSPRMRALAGAGSRIRVGSEFEEIDTETGLSPTEPNEHTLLMNLFDPRAHLTNQDWTVTYEGRLPGFSNRFAELVELSTDRFRLTDPTSAFCSRGVQSQGALVDQLLAEGVSEENALSQSAPMADYVQVFSSFPVEADPYWESQNECTFNACNAVYGSTETPREARDLRIIEAFDDSVELEPRASLPGDAPRLKCCFPGVVEFRVRPGRQWTVVGNAVGFLHRMTIADDGTCRPTCDDISRLETGRVIEAGPDEVVSIDDPEAFVSPFFEFAINGGASQRDMTFTMTTKGFFEPLVLRVVTSDEDVQPTAASFLSPTGEIVVSDGSLQGITLIDIDDLAISRQFN